MNIYDAPSKICWVILTKEMRMEHLNEYTKESLIFPHLVMSSREEVLDYMSNKLKDEGYVTEQFIDGVKSREREFPTGLKLGYIGCAIPHSEKEFVNKPAVSICILKDEVLFQNMENPMEEISVKIIFMLAINNSEQQLSVLQEVIGLIQSEETINKLIKAKSKREILSVLELSEIS